MPDEELIRLYDAEAGSTTTGTEMYRKELERRTTERSTRTLTRLTWAILGATIVLAILTIVLIWLTWVIASRG